MLKESLPRGANCRYCVRRGLLLPGLAPGLRLPHSRLQLLGLVGGGYGIDDVLEVALQYALEVMDGQADTVIGNSTLGKIVGSNLLRAVACAYLRTAGIGHLLELTLAFLVQEASTKHCHSFDLVLQLRTFVLADNHHACGEVC